MSQNTAVKERKAKPVARKDMSRAAWTLKEMKKNKAGYIMIAPFFILFFVFTVVPVFLSMILNCPTIRYLR